MKNESESEEISYSYRPLRRNGSKYATEVGVINREPENWKNNRTGDSKPQKAADDPKPEEAADEAVAVEPAINESEVTFADDVPESPEPVVETAVPEPEAIEPADDSAEAEPESAEIPVSEDVSEPQANDITEVADEIPPVTPYDIEADSSEPIEITGVAAVAANNPNPEIEEEDDVVFMKKPVDDDDDDDEVIVPKKKRAGKILLIVAALFLIIILGLVGAYFVLHEMGRRSIHNYEGMEVITPTADEAGNDIISTDKYGRIITYDGVSYTYNDDIIALTLIGVDNGAGDKETSQMADFIYILTIDSKTGKTKLLGVSRDIMTDVDVFSAEGTFIETQKKQIAYSYSYHSSTKTGGDNTNTSVSRLFFGLPTKNYFAFNLDALVDLNDAVGGVTVTSKLEFKSPVDGRMIHEGDEVTLHGKEAEYYVRHRDTSVLESNNDRMERQQDYIKSFLSTVFSEAKSDLSIVSSLYNTVKENSDSTLDLSELTYIASIAVSKLDSTNDIEYVSLKGKIVSNGSAEMYVTNEEVMRKMLDVFYKPMTTANGETKNLAAQTAETNEKAKETKAGTKKSESKTDSQKSETKAAAE